MTNRRSHRVLTMTTNLKIFAENDSTDFTEYTDFNEIQKVLAAEGIQIEKWIADEPVDLNSSQEQILNAYAADVEKIKKQGGYTTADVVSVHSATPNRNELRKKFLAEHVHNDNEIRFFVEGSGMFYIHHKGKVFMLLCAKNDLINVPAGVKHWFDMGANPDFKCIRIFTDPEGWVGHFTGEKIAEAFPYYEN